ncbi:hypothetical protein GCM10022281_11490 [Sphingomonas rosea]|uniref:Peptidase M24 C-terminal domain-containing protein n=1 Tax=Sphingomonas rosea TaxID=335605 RepID=A0ABP7TZM9_9SPHN
MDDDDVVPALWGGVRVGRHRAHQNGEYGIRTENLILVVPKTIEGADREMLGFETLTFAPIDRRLIVTEMLSPRERQWVDDYHAEVVKRIAPGLAAGERAWLEAACAPL